MLEGRDTGKKKKNLLIKYWKAWDCKHKNDWQQLTSLTFFKVHNGNGWLFEFWGF